MKTELTPISQVKANPNNPRIIKDDKFKKLVKSIQDFPKMLDLRPIVVNDDMVVLGGNMRLKACKEAGLKEVPVIKASELTEDEQRQFIIKDNVGFGEWDWDTLANEWDAEQLDAWGLDVPELKELIEQDLFDIEIPFYTPSEQIPTVYELAEMSKAKELIYKINKLDINEELKELLITRASFFVDYQFNKIADYYHYQSDEIKDIFKELGLVILAPKEALEMGFVKLSTDVVEI